MLTVGLTGGIGSGKSAVSALLVSHGAVLLDSDVMAREVVAPGTPGLAEVVEAFGPDVLLPEGSLDRERLGRLVFGDPRQLARLNAVVHPRVRERSAALAAEAQAAGAAVVVHDVPLLVENAMQDRYDVVVVVAARPETQLARLVGRRGMTEQDARARIAAQAPLEAKLAAATHVIWNDGPFEDLPPQVERLWSALVAASEAGAGR